MNHNRELRVYMKAAYAEVGDVIGGHLSEDEMIAFCQGGAAEAEGKVMRSHISQCSQCLQLFKNVNDFFDPRREDEEEISQSQTRRAWKDFWPRANVEKKAAAVIAKSERRRSPSGMVWPLAAGLLIALGLATIFVWRENREKQQAQRQLAQLQNRNRDIEGRLSHLEQTAGDQLKQEREQRAQAEARVQALQNQVDDLQRSQQNIPIYTRLLSSQKGEGDDWQLSVPSAAQIFWLSLTRSKPYEFPEYSIELIDQRGQKVAERHGLKPVASGYLSFALSRSALQAGKYRLRLYGSRGKTSQKLGEYELSLSFPR